ncbi:MAG: hypothetical protein ACK550_10125 [Synechococcaceae cyanobacterium]|jgi:hypothetical protein
MARPAFSPMASQTHFWSPLSLLRTNMGRLVVWARQSRSLARDGADAAVVLAMPIVGLRAA